MRVFLAVALLVAGSPAAGAAQTVAELIATGSAEERDPDLALAAFERALALDSTSYEANWRAATALVDLGEAAGEKPARDSLYARAQRYARRAVAADSTRPEGLFALAVALGRTALTRGTRERIRLGDEVHRLVLRVLELAPDHDGAHHVLGLWNAEVMRISGVGRFLARTLLGGKTLSEASWEAAVTHLERAVALDSTRIAHRLDLARVYLDRKRLEDARRQLDAIERLPDRHAGDPRYRVEAERLRPRLRR
jgi:tetratricopeptide (TPR) repeat protein